MLKLGEIFTIMLSHTYVRHSHRSFELKVMRALVLKILWDAFDFSFLEMTHENDKPDLISRYVSEDAECLLS